MSATFERIEELFHAAVVLDSAERARLLDAECDGDAKLRAAVEELLRFDAAPTQLVSPVADVADVLRGDSTTAANGGDRRPKTAELPNIPGYELLGIIGQGGMGVVYKARQLSLKRVVALKMLVPSNLAAVDPLPRFKAEAEILGRLNLPGLVPVYDVGEWMGRPFFTMEYVPGPDLAQVIGGRPQNVAMAAQVVESLARTMHSVHQAGIIHRDLKPANVLLSTGSATPRRVGRAEGEVHRAGTDVDGFAVDLAFSSPHPTPRITDFGVAKDFTHDRDLTLTGAAVGTPRYMAPEQARGQDAGPAADIYALGTILYEMLVGRAPFDGGSAAETFEQLLHDDPVPPQRLRPSLPRDLTTICLKCLEKTPAARYASALDLADDLRRYLESKPIRARAVGVVGRTVRWCRRRPLVAGLSLLSSVLGLAFVGGLILTTQLLKADIVQLNVQIGRDNIDDGDTLEAALYFAEALRLDPQLTLGDHRKSLRDALANSPRLTGLASLPGQAICASVVGSAVRVAVVADDTLQVWDGVTGTRLPVERKLDSPPVHGLFSADGQWLAVKLANGTVVVGDLRTGKWYTASPPPSHDVERVVAVAGKPMLVCRSADGVHLFDAELGRPAEVPWPAGDVAADARWLVTLDADGRGRLRAATGRDDRPGPDSRAAAVSPDGRRVLLNDDLGTARVWDVASGRPVTPPLPHDGPLTAVAFAGDGEHWVTVSRQGLVRHWDARPPESSEHLASMAQILACSQIDARQQRRPLDRAAIWRAWQRVAAK